MDFLQVTGLNKQDREEQVLTDVNFTQEKFQKLAIAGETGSGKSTLMKCVAGLVQPDAGKIYFENTRVVGPLFRLIPGHPGIAFLSQQYELRNNYRVEEILQYANNLPAEDANYLYETCEISHLMKRLTSQLSGGEKQRIALTRLLISSPRLLLLDEPYSNLDMIHKNTLKSVIRVIGEKLRITCILVSHDPMDTLSWADEIMVMKDGRIIQKGSPANIYRQPVNEYVAGLFGKYNLVSPAQFGLQANGKKIFLRPDNFSITSEQPGTFTGTAEQVSFMGPYTEIELNIMNQRITVRTDHHGISTGDRVSVGITGDQSWQL
jgi:ABC-type sugar transport system ATPase subunit